MDKNQAQGILERAIYGVATAIAMLGVKWGWYDSDMAAYVAGGMVMGAGGAYAWWVNRPKAIATAAAVNGAKVVVPDQKLADSIANPNVLGPADAAVVKK